MDEKKKELAIQISIILLDIDPPRIIAGGTIPKEWIAEAIQNTPGCEDIDVEEFKKPKLMRAGIETLGGEWDEKCTSRDF